MKTIRFFFASLACLAALFSGAVAQADSVTHDDASFMRAAAQAGSMEIEGSKLALSKASSAQVKTFAQQMIDDHTKAAQELSALAAAKGVKLPDGPSLTQKAELKLLGLREGASFDAQYAQKIGLSAHEDAVNLFIQAAKSSKDAEVLAFANRTLPTLRHHLEMARELAATTPKP